MNFTSRVFAPRQRGLGSTPAPVATVLTKLTPAQALGGLVAAGCPQTALLMVAAQSADETAGWAAMHNWNYGNTTPTTAQVAAGVPYMTQGVQGMRYLAFSDPVVGARNMLAWLQAHGLLSYAVNNDLAGYIERLKTTCYLGCVGLTDSTGHTISDQDYDNYQAGISSWRHRLQNVVPQPPPMPSIMTPSDWTLPLVVSGSAIATMLALRHYHQTRRPTRRYAHA